MNAAHRQQGLMLPAVLILLFLGGLGWLLAQADSNADRAARRLAEETQTRLALDMARDALLGFAATYRNKEHPNADFGYLPCPDLDGDGSSETCGTKDQPSIGHLPYRTLNLPDLRDGAGECLWYAVAGNFKNNPKADVVNWDSTGQFHLQDGEGHSIALSGDQTGLAAALVIAAGPPLPNQARKTSPGRCGSDQEANQRQHYIEALGDTHEGITEVRTAPTDGNDRLVTITAGEIYDKLKNRSGYADHLQGVMQALADCLVKAGLPSPVDPEHHGTVELGRLPPLAPMTGPCASPVWRDPAGNWAEMTRYARCLDGADCLSSLHGKCRGALLFGGERRSASPPQYRITPLERQTTAQYLESSTLIALANGQLDPLPEHILQPFGASNDATSTDVALCLP